MHKPRTCDPGKERAAGKYRWIVLWFLTVLALTGCAGAGQARIQEFSAAGTDSAAAETELLNDLVEEYCGTSLKTAGSSREENQIYLICDEESAAELGHVIAEWDSNTFMLDYRDSGLYLISPTRAGLVRAAVYLVRNCVAEDGSLLLTEGDVYAVLGTGVKDEVYVGETPIEEYTITYSDKSLRALCRELQYYISQTGGGYVPVEKTSSGPAIHLTLDKAMSEGERSLVIEDGVITLTAADETALQREVYLFLDTYLGWIKTGTDQAHISNTASAIRVPENVETVSDPWIEEREAIVTLWNTNYTRGFYLNENVNLLTNLIDYSEDQLYEYVKMLKYCGFTGVQATEMCSAWAGVGGYDAAHFRIRMLADAAHSLDMKFTLWVWGAEFSDAGWVDPEVPDSFYGGYAYAKENPQAVAAFEKYYSIYAELADCCDRVIGHYYDPGNLQTEDDIAYFARMLRDKFRAGNPDVDFGISCWVDLYDKSIFVRELGQDLTLYENGHHDDESRYVPFRTSVRDLGTRLGTWSWNGCEMEIDQLAQMNFNLDILREIYQTARQYDEIDKPDYWSEMDSYHLLNVFSLYCAGHMLIDPDIGSEALCDGIATAAVGPEYAEDFAQMLGVIQDARSGHSWDTYFWSNDNYVLKSDDYPAQSILDRCDRYIPVLKGMIASGAESYTLPLPVSLKDLLTMMLSHLLQIRSYAEFRLELAKLEEAYAGGADAEDLAVRLYEIAEPIEEYDCIIGSWGQIEARAQAEMTADFCRRTGLEVPRYPEFDGERKQYILSQLICFQKDSARMYSLSPPYYQLGLAFGQEETARLVEELVQDGYLVRLEEGRVRLRSWERYTYRYIGAE